MTDRSSTVHVVDDDAPVRKSLEGSLAERGYAVETFASAEAFLGHLESGEHPGCLLLDVRMPSMSGLELQDRLQAMEMRMPIIFLSGHGDIPMAVHAVRAGAIDFLEKPYRLNVLVERIDEALDLDARIRRASTERRRIRARYQKLTPREREVLRLLADRGATSNKIIARTLDISHRTVEVHRARIMRKMHASSLADLAAMAISCDYFEVVN